MSRRARDRKWGTYEPEDVYWTETLLSDPKLGVKDMERPVSGLDLPHVAEEIGAGPWRRDDIPKSS